MIEVIPCLRLSLLCCTVQDPASCWAPSPASPQPQTCAPPQLPAHPPQLMHFGLISVQYAFRARRSTDYQPKARVTQHGASHVLTTYSYMVRSGPCNVAAPHTTKPTGFGYNCTPSPWLAGVCLPRRHTSKLFPQMDIVTSL